MSTEPFILDVRTGECVSVLDPSMTLVGDIWPEWVRLPEDLGGKRAEVIGGVSDWPCRCGSTHTGAVLDANVNGMKVLVVQCNTEGYNEGFLWYGVELSGGSNGAS